MSYESPSAGTRWLVGNWANLAIAYRFRWVASLGDGLVANSETAAGAADQAYQALAASNQDPANLAFAFIDGQEFETEHSI